MSYYLSSLIITYITVIALWIYVIWCVLKRWREEEMLREQREAARAAENEAFDYIMRLRIELEKAMQKPVEVHGERRKPMRKAVGLFSDSEAQKMVQ